MIDEATIMRLAGKNRKAIKEIWAVNPYDEEIEFTVVLKNGYIQEQYNNTMIVLDESEDESDVEYLLSLIVKE